MNYKIAIADCKQWQLPRPRVGHIRRDRKKLLEKEEGAKCGALHVPLKHKICGQQQRHAQLQERPAGYVQELPAEKPEEQVPALVDWNKDEVDHEERTTSSGRL